MNKIKDKIVREIIKLGKKSRRLRIPALMLVTLFLVIYHAIRDFFLQFRYHPARQRILVGILTISLLVGQSGILMVLAESGTDTTAAAEAEDGEADNAGSRKITAFAELPDDIKVQTVPVGTAVDELMLPNTLEAVCMVISTGSEEAHEDETEGEENMEEEIPETQEEPTGGEEIEGDAEQPQDADTEEAEEQPEDTDTYITDDEVIIEETVTVTMPEYQAENVIEVEAGVLEYSAWPEQETWQFKEETVTIENIEWQSEPEYDGDTAGEYIFTTVLPEGYEPAEGVSLPKISVTVEETTRLATLYALNSAEIVGPFTITGGTLETDYTYANSVLMIISDTPITIQNTDPGVATKDRIEVKGGVSANITLAGVNIDVRNMSDTAAFKIDDDSTGNVTITLADGTTNVLRSGQNSAGLQKIGEVSSGTLTITGKTGSLTATGGDGGAGIGGRNYGGSGSNITIKGGEVTATGGFYGAGIGGGAGIRVGYGGNGSNIEISGGEVTATGGFHGAGIGGGLFGSGSNITISGGTVKATGTGGGGRQGGAGIGGGGEGSGGSHITISGGSVTAMGGEYGAGIGGGGSGSGSDITISGGSVTAMGGEYGAGIGGGINDRGAEGEIIISGSRITIRGGEVTAMGGESGAGIGGGYKGSGSNIEIRGGNVTATGGNYGAGIGGGNYGSGSDIPISNASVSAKGGSEADHIGSGRSGGSGSNINISNSLVIEGNTGTVIGNAKVSDDFTIDGDVTLEIGNGTSLTVEREVTLTNKGTITNNGSMTNHGTIDIYGKLVNNTTITNNSTIHYYGSIENIGIILDPSIPEPAARINYEEEFLGDLERNVSYTIRDAAGTSQIIIASASGTIAIESGWFGKDFSIMKNGTDYEVGRAQKLSIQKRPDAPAGLGSTESYQGENGGTITGLQPGFSYEVSNDGGKTWTAVTLSGTTITGLASGSYLVRVKAGNNNFRSVASAAVTVRMILITPTAVIDYEKAALTGLDAGAVYSIGGINGESKEVKADNSGSIAIADEWFGVTISIVRKGDGSLTVDSAEQEIYIPMKEAAPVTAKGVDVSASGKTDGKIIGLTADEIYEISTNSGSTWETRTADENSEITDLAQGSYLIRTKAKDDPEKTFRSDSVKCTISAPNSQTGGIVGGSGSSSGGSGTSDTTPDGGASDANVNNQNIGSDNNSTDNRRTDNGKTNNNSNANGTEDQDDEAVSDSSDIPVGKNGTTVTIPEGKTAETNDDGTVTVPEGAVVHPGNGGPDITVGEKGGTVDEAGSVTVPGGSVRIGDAVITLPAEGGTIIPNADGTVTVPAGSIITREGQEPVTVTGNGAVFDPKTGIITIIEDIKAEQNESEPSDVSEDVQQPDGGEQDLVDVDDSGNNMAVILILVATAALATGGCFILFRIRRTKRK